MYPQVIMTRITTIRIIKYGLNLIGLIWMFYVAKFAYGMIVRYPDCDRVWTVIWNVAKDLFLLYLLYLTAVFAINYLIERRLEKRNLTKEYLIVAFIQIILLLLVTIYVSLDFFRHCVESI